MVTSTSKGKLLLPGEHELENAAVMHDQIKNTTWEQTLPATVRLVMLLTSAARASVASSLRTYMHLASWDGCEVGTSPWIKKA